MSKRKAISQREARRTRKELSDLRDLVSQQISRWSSAYPGGTHIQSLNLDATCAARAEVAQRLGFAMVCKIDGSKLLIYAVKP